jgi:hypothetical protein
MTHSSYATRRVALRYLLAGHKHPIPGLRDPHGDKRIFDGLKASPPTIRVVPKSMSKA